MNNDRGMAKWMPYKSLVDQTSSLARMRYKKNKIEKPRISNDKAEEMDEILRDYSGETVKAKYWEDGYIYEIEGPILKIDVFERVLRFIGKNVPLKNLVDLVRI
ncbi:MAG: YolD-like family protein [Bacilli bacterium]|nr:YolD-like family protein [Bacilli bacterium]